MTNYDCPKHGDYPADRPGSYTPQYECPSCERDARSIETAWRAEWNRWHRAEASGIPARFARATLSTWTPADQLQSAAKTVVQGWCDGMTKEPHDGGGLLLTGAPGLGKTHLACAALVEVMKRTAMAVAYASWPDTLTKVKAAFGSARTQPDLLEALKGVQVLALDELGVRAGSEFDATTLFDLIDYRYREALPTIVCTNLTAKEFVPVLGERVADRLREMTRTVYLKGESRRAAGRGIAATQPLPITEPTHRIEVPRCSSGKAGTRWITYAPTTGGRRREFGVDA